MISKNDKMVEKTQQWLNDNYKGKTGYDEIPVTGITGWTTIYALLHALQIELGITATADNFGPSTIARFNTRFPEGIKQQDYPSEKEENIYGIIQGALWCKGYSTGADTITKHFYSGTGGAVQKMKEDAGCKDTSSIVTLNVMKALMSMTQFKTVKEGDLSIQVAQKEMNYGYEAYIGLAPCDGVYGRDMNQAMIKVLQAIEGFSVEDATGNFGEKTKAKLPILPNLGQLSEETEKQAVKLVRYSLVCNGYNVSVNSDQWDNKLGDIIEQFQTNMSIEVTRICDTNTWMSLLLSRGNPERNCIACDMAADLKVSSRMKFIKDNGYKIVGRYINGGTAVKELEPGELKTIVENNLMYFPIYQRNGSADISKFTEEMAHEDAFEASKALVKHGIPENAIVYFAVDFDAQNSDITNYIIPYFKIIMNEFDSGCKVGIYGTRNVCEQVLKSDIGVTTCFVSDISTGYSGNMGFKIPENWNLDQFFELKWKQPVSDRINVNYPSNFDLDRVAYSGRYPVESTVDLYVSPDKTNIANKKNITWFNNSCVKIIEKYAVQYLKEANENAIINADKVAILVLNALRYYKYNSGQWKFTLGEIDVNFMEYFTRKYQEEEGKIFSLEYGHYLSDDDDMYLLVDNNNSVIDFAHLSATTEGYYKSAIVPKFWTGWGGDLATAMARVQSRRNENKSINELANEIVCSGVKGTDGHQSPFNYSDTCCDADAIKIAELIKKSDDYTNPVSKAIETYYCEYSQNRYKYYIEDIVPHRTARNDLYAKVYYMMTNIFSDGVNVITFKGGGAEDDVARACCKAFANYIMTEI